MWYGSSQDEDTSHDSTSSHEGAMSVQVVTAVSPVLRLDEPGRLEQTTPLELPRNESPSQDACFTLTCRDVIHGVRQRLANKGRTWD